MVKCICIAYSNCYFCLSMSVLFMTIRTGTTYKSTGTFQILFPKRHWLTLCLSSVSVCVRVGVGACFTVLLSVGRGGGWNFCLGGPKIQGGLGAWPQDYPPPWQSHWVCTVTTSGTGRRWGGPQDSPHPPPPHTVSGLLIDISCLVIFFVKSLRKNVIKWRTLPA